MQEPQVYIVTSGDYSDYCINSVWLTLKEAEAAAGDWGTVEVWPLGDSKRTLGSFHRSCNIDVKTFEVKNDMADDGPEIAKNQRVSVIYWPEGIKNYANQLGIRVTADTNERADKVYSEVRARVLAELSQGLPLESIADSKYVKGDWKPTDRKGK